MSFSNFSPALPNRLETLEADRSGVTIPMICESKNL